MREMVVANFFIFLIYTGYFKVSDNDYEVHFVGQKDCQI